MRKVLIISTALLILVLGASISSAQIPNVQVYFTSDYGTYGHTHLDSCPDVPGGLDSLYVVASNFGMWMSAIEYKVVYPWIFTWLTDNTGGLDIGASPTGITSAWTFPLNAFFPVSVNKVYFLYNCQKCYEGTDIPIDVVPHPETGFVRAVRWPDDATVNAIGMRSLICPTIPTEETTWGTIKALYNN